MALVPARTDISWRWKADQEMTDRNAITIVGAGPAGLACAIVLARAGRPVVVREWKDRVGHRFHDDFQGLENWSRGPDVLDELAAAGIAADFEHCGFDKGIHSFTGLILTV